MVYFLSLQIVMSQESGSSLYILSVLGKKQEQRLNLFNFFTSSLSLMYIVTYPAQVQSSCICHPRNVLVSSTHRKNKSLLIITICDRLYVHKCHWLPTLIMKFTYRMLESSSRWATWLCVSGVPVGRALLSQRGVASVNRLVKRGTTLTGDADGQNSLYH